MIGLVTWAGSTIYFGLNETAINGWERLWDGVSSLLMIYGFFGDIARSVRPKTEITFSKDAFTVSSEPK